MANQTGAGMLAERLGIDSEQAAGLLDRFAGGLAAELLGTGRLSVEGLGAFSVVHDQAERTTSGQGAVFMPPKNRIVFDSRSPSKGDLSRISMERLGMDAVEARGFATALVATFGQLRKQPGEFELRGFGIFSTVDGQYGFRADPGLDGLINSVYEGLKSISMPDRTASPDREGNGRLKTVGITALLLLLCVGAYVALRPMLPGVSSPVPAPELTARAPASSPEPAGPEVGSAASSKSATPDSLILEKGRYTVIAATFSTARVARDEARRLAGLGHRIMIWPVHDGGRILYRLVSGDFATPGEARDSLRAMPAGLTKNVYIHQAPKTVVIYGEKGL